jgi:hypothetical protein
MRVSSAIPATDHQRLIRSLELKLELLEHGFGMPRDEDAIARTKALLKEAERGSASISVPLAGARPRSECTGHIAV